MKGAKKILRALTKAGYEAYLVGGIVRDTLLGRACHDIDITTSARAEQTLEVAKAHGWRCMTVGKAFGCVVILIGGSRYEVTAFRAESYADDAHRPTEVVYGVSLAEDVKRRDFTINGMVMTADGEVIDQVGGRADLKAKVIRCIGDGKERFAEDALRALRACRFSAQLGFDLDRDIMPAIRANLHRVRALSVERVRAELDKTLVAPHSARGLEAMMTSGLLASSVRVRAQGEVHEVAVLPELVHLVGLRQNPRYHAYDAWNHTKAVVESLPPELTLRWAGLLHDVAKGLDGIRGEKNGQPTDYGHAKLGGRMATIILRRLGYPKALVKRVAWLIGEHMTTAPLTERTAVRWLKKRAVDFADKGTFLDALRQLDLLFRADEKGTGLAHEIVRADSFAEVFALAEHTPLFLHELAVTGKDLTPILGQGAQVKEHLLYLLERVQSHTLVNEREALVAATIKLQERRSADAPPSL